MFAWNEKYKFIFSDLGASDKVGVNDVGIGVFKKKPYIGLTKEILQNSTDAPDPSLPETPSPDPRPEHPPPSPLSNRHLREYPRNSTRG